MMKKGWILSLCCLLTFSVFSQYLKQNSYTIPNLVDSGAKYHSPRKATLLAVAIPGAGQRYNRTYWKAGIVWAGFGGLAYNFKVSVDSLKSYQEAIKIRADGDSNTVDLKYAFLTDRGIIRQRDQYRRRRDLSIVGSFLLYALQIIDANVDAHLMEFKVNKDLAIKPVGLFDPQISNAPIIGLGFRYQLN